MVCQDKETGRGQCQVLQQAWPWWAGASSGGRGPWGQEPGLWGPCLPCCGISPCLCGRGWGRGHRGGLERFELDSRESHLSPPPRYKCPEARVCICFRAWLQREGKGDTVREVPRAEEGSGCTENTVGLGTLHGKGSCFPWCPVCQPLRKQTE